MFKMIKNYMRIDNPDFFCILGRFSLLTSLFKTSRIASSTAKPILGMTHFSVAPSEDYVLMRAAWGYLSVQALWFLRSLYGRAAHICCTVTSRCKWPQMRCWAVVADEQLLCLLDVLLTFSQNGCFSLAVAALGLSSRAGRGAQMPPVGPPALTQHKVIVGGGTHGIKHVGFVWDLELLGGKRNEVMKCCNFFSISVLCLLLFQLVINGISQNDMENNF